MEARVAATSVFQFIDQVYVFYYLNFWIFIYIIKAEEANTNEKDIWTDNMINKRLIGIGDDIQFNNVNFSYPSRKDLSVLHNFNLIARAGEITALVGSSGSGMSFIKI